MACQFALAGGNTVVGLAGNDEKMAALKKLGVQHAVNYKAHGSEAQLAEHIRGLVGDVDIVWEVRASLSIFLGPFLIRLFSLEDRGRSDVGKFEWDHGEGRTRRDYWADFVGLWRYGRRWFFSSRSDR